MEPCVLILSGGMDSATLLYQLRMNNGVDVHAISFDYGQRHKRELECAQKLCNRLGVIQKVVSLQALNEVAPSSLTRPDMAVPEGHYAEEVMKQTVVPNRNMVMLSLAAAYAMGMKIPYLYYGAHGGDHAIYPDCRPMFIEAMRRCLAISDWEEVELMTPFINLHKGEIAKLGIEMGMDYSMTWTCYKGGEKACGKCGSCVERLEAFKFAGVADPLQYEGQ